MSARTSIHTSIEAAMGSLDLTLESELTLFRNRYSGAKVPQEPSQPPAPTQRPEPRRVDAFSAQPLDEPFAYHEDDTILEAPGRHISASDDLASEAARLLDVSLEEEMDDGAIDTAYLQESDEQNLSESEYLDEDMPTGAIVPSKALLPSERALADSATLETYTDPALDDYLESSEVLLKHLDAPAPRNQLDNSVSLKWFAWAAGATLLLSSLAAFFLQNVFQTPKSPPEPVNSENPSQVAPPKPTDNEPEASPSDLEVSGPDLSAKEFQKVKPGSLAELPTPDNKAETGSTVSSPETAETSPPNPETQSQSATPEESAPAPSQAASRQYYVVTAYVDESSLEAAKKLVPQAKKVTFTTGTKIQLQQLSDESTARTAAAEYEQKGLSVEILASSSE